MASKVSLFTTPKELARAMLMLLTSAQFLTGCIDDGGPRDTETGGIPRAGDIISAKVGPTFIYQSDVLRAAAAQKRVSSEEGLDVESPQYAEILDELIDQRLLKLAALEAGQDEILEIKYRLAESRERILAAYFVESRLQDAVTEASLKQMYAAQSSLRQNSREAKVSLIRVKTEAEIKAIAQKLAAGESFAELARQLSIERGADDNGGELGYVSEAMIPKDIADVVFSTKAGTRSKPFEAQGGWVIVSVQDFRFPAQASFESMRAQLHQYKTYTEVQNLMIDLRENADVEILIGPSAANNETENE